RATPYHPLASFAPTHDVTDAATSHVELSGVLAAAALDEAVDLLAVLQQGPAAPAVAGLAMPSSAEQAAARAELGKAEGLDFDAVLEGYRRTLSGRDGVTVVGTGSASTATAASKLSAPAAVCKENGVLMELLSVLQEERYKGVIDRPLLEEGAIASIVADNLATLLQEPGVEAGPLHLPSNQAMAALQLDDAGYKGTLPMNKPYAFKLNTAARR
ncbi:hypothetical protein HK405_001283, partial [Cladochytrium tenue]